VTHQTDPLLDSPLPLEAARRRTSSQGTRQSTHQPSLPTGSSRFQRPTASTSARFSVSTSSRLARSQPRSGAFGDQQTRGFTKNFALGGHEAILQPANAAQHRVSAVDAGGNVSVAASGSR
jgi:hypothetical protein